MTVFFRNTTANSAGIAAYNNMSGMTAAFWATVEAFDNHLRVTRDQTKLCKCSRSGWPSFKVRARRLAIENSTSSIG